MAGVRPADSELNKRFQLKPNQKEIFCSVFVLNQIANQGMVFAPPLTGNQKNLETLLQWMTKEQLLGLKEVETQKKSGALRKDSITEYRYIPTDKGRQLLTDFLKRYQEYIKLYDLYCAVDLAKGEFAFTRYFELSGDDFKVYLTNERWEDLRIAIAEFKKLEPIEIVFMSFLREDRVDITKDNWEGELVSDALWAKILNICNTNISLTELGYDKIPADDVIKDFIKKGMELMFSLHKQEEAEAARQTETEAVAAGAGGSTAVQEEVVTEVATETVFVDPYPIAYYDPYWDPYYISPIWAVPLLIMI